MTRQVALMVAVSVLLAVPHAEAKKEFPDPIFVAPEFYEVDFDMIWILPTANELPPDGEFKRKVKRMMTPIGAAKRLKRRGYRVRIAKPKKTAYDCTWDDLNSEDTEWMGVLEQEERRFVFLTAVKDYDQSAEKKRDSVLIMSGYLFDTQERRLLWHGESGGRLGGGPGRTARAVAAGVIIFGIIGGDALFIASAVPGGGG